MIPISASTRSLLADYVTRCCLNTLHELDELDEKRLECNTSAQPLGNKSHPTVFIVFRRQTMAHKKGLAGTPLSWDASPA